MVNTSDSRLTQMTALSIQGVHSFIVSYGEEEFKAPAHARRAPRVTAMMRTPKAPARASRSRSNRRA